MTQKDYVLFAAMLKRWRNDDYVPFATLMNSVMELFAKDNPKFSRTKFVKAVAKSEFTAKELGVNDIRKDNLKMLKA